MIALCALADILDPGCKGPFVVSGEGGGVRVFLVRMDGELRGFVNSCPHVGVALNMEDDDFLDLDRAWIRCSLHGARFDPLTGACVLGPCRGKKLKGYEVHIRNGMVMTGSPIEGL